MFNSRYRIVEESNMFYPETKFLYLFWSRYVYPYSQLTVCFTTLKEAEDYLRNVTSKTKHNRTIHEFKF